MSYRIPATIKHDDFLVAIQPLLDLCGVHANEVYTDIHITGSGANSTSLNRITFNVTVPADAVEAAEYPEAVPVSRFQEFSELSVHCTVEVV